MYLCHVSDEKKLKRKKRRETYIWVLICLIAAHVLYTFATLLSKALVAIFGNINRVHLIPKPNKRKKLRKMHPFMVHHSILHHIPCVPVLIKIGGFSIDSLGASLICSHCQFSLITFSS